MRKVTKILAMLLSAIILLLIILPLSLSIALSLDSVQRFAVEHLTNFASEKIGAKVNIGAIAFSAPRQITLYDVLVEDHSQDTMIFAQRVKVKPSALSIISKNLVISDVKATNSELRLRETSDGTINIKEIVQRITNPEKESQFKTTIDNITFDNFQFSLKRLESKKRDYGVDLSDIEINNIDAELSNLISFQRVTELDLDSFTGVEKSGLTINSMSGHLVTYEGVIDITNMRSKSKSSQLSMPRIRIESDSWDDYKDFNSKVSLDITSQRSTLSSSDVAYFAPALKGTNFTAHNISAVANGTVNNLETDIKSMEFGKDGSLVANATIKDVTEIERAEVDIQKSTLKGSLTDINNVLISFGADPLEQKASEIVGSLGDMSLSSVAQGSVDSMKVKTLLRSKIGEASFDGSLKSILSQIQVAGAVTTNKLELGKLLSNNTLGAIDMQSDISYNTPQSGLQSSAKGTIAQVGYKSYNYSNIDFDLSYCNDTIDGAIASHDKNINFDLTSVINIGKERYYDMSLRVHNADLNALHINTRDSISRISGSARVNLSGNTIEDMSGTVTLRNANYRYNDKSIYAPMIDLVARNNSDSKYISLGSDFVDMTFNSKSSIGTLITYLKEGIRDYIPILYTSPTERKNGEEITIADNYSTLNVNFKKFEEISNAITSGFNIADNSSVNVMVNPHNERFSLRVKSDYIEYKQLAATQLNINASNDNDSLSLYSTASDIYWGHSSFSTYTLMAGARDNVVEISTGFRDHDAGTAATLGAKVTFDSQRHAKIKLRPSHILMDDDMWMISATDITAADATLDIDNFSIVNGEQQLRLNGVISKDPTDSLILQLNNYDISMITSVVNNLGYSISGISNGFVNIKQLLGSPRVVADVKLDSIDVNSIPSPPLKLSAGWDTEQNRASIFINNRNDNKTLVTGYYMPSDMRYYAHLQVDSLNCGLIDPLLKSTISDTRGYANVDVTLRGQHKDASLHGTIDAYDLKTRILYTQVEYSVPSARIEVDDNILVSRAQRMYDNQGNSGLITLNLSLDHLSNVSYNLRIVPENMLVLNTTEKDNELFYGKLYASGVATINGDKRGVNMDITATSKPNSSFFMPLSTKLSVAKTDFITFAKAKGEEDINNIVNFRRNYSEQRRKRLNAQSSARLNINMALHATPDLDFQLVIDPVVGDIIKARGEGRMNINIAPQENKFEMYGDYNITEGNYLFTLLNPISKRFTIDRGSSIQWTGDAIDPLLDIDAVYKVKTSLDPLINGTSGYASESNATRAVPVDCIIHLGDRLAQPSVDFSIEVPTADTEQQAVIANTLIDQETISQQFFYLMFANSFIPVTTSYGSGLATTTSATTGFELLTNQLSNWLSSSNYNVVIRYRPESDLTSDEVDLGFSRGLIDNRLLIEVEGNYLADNKTALDDNFSNFMGEAYVTWLIDRAGTLRLKGFTQTIDRYDENQGLQETGIGVYYSESFNTFKELGQKIRNRFRRKKQNSKN